MGKASAVPAGASRPAVRPALSLRSKGRKGMAGASRPARPAQCVVSRWPAGCWLVVGGACPGVWCLVAVLPRTFAACVCLEAARVGLFFRPLVEAGASRPV